MYWFVLPAEKNSSLTLLASAIEGGNAAVEKGFESHFKSSKIKGDSITLSMERAFLNDSGTYYCAEGEHSGETAGRSEHKLLPAQTGSAFHLLGAAQGRGQLAARRGPCSMDFHRFLVATLLPVGWALQQSPDTVVRVGDSVTLECSGSGNAFRTMCWYKLPMERDANMQLVVYSVEGRKADIEKEFQNRFQSNGTKNNHLSVKIEHALLNDTGTYFCAEQDPQ
ncbi:uncharacterized protein LOC117010747 isoform X9 [Catharus ustulatus]|uniref:uncharacterized protein LOC117010747 isoform X9 n=1 Tax=Catharus ustulatus TaxID=91951 RepID=UPI00140C3084|nr:uncharacterized protein LOC117010747 isoform X9 [Catharus ustulatus]